MTFAFRRICNITNCNLSIRSHKTYRIYRQFFYIIFDSFKRGELIFNHSKGRVVSIKF